MKLVQNMEEKEENAGSHNDVFKSFHFQGSVYETSPDFYVSHSLQSKSFENTVGKGKIACDKQFFFYPQCFLLV